MPGPSKNKLKLQFPTRPPQLSLADSAEGADHPLTELARLLARRAARRCYQDQLQERRSKDS
ncbi:hypothetical protein [Phenylobacterium montanum]|uniref:Uncharacterized protein n=1 Tax=Phenylobacterium montanum TaxID=2823693 RepID=A0A975G3G5_9CAUL|nr:hypothetical protein [Caulobacter sp. S6]QUD89872.1 hypothetical protein KCG34_08375 [Caulobacter sp. S6]